MREAVKNMDKFKAILNFLYPFSLPLVSYKDQIKT